MFDLAPPSSIDTLSQPERGGIVTARTYEIDRYSVVKRHIAIWGFTVYVVSSFRSPAVTSAIFIAACVALYLSLRKGRLSAVSIDDDGIWRVQDGKEKGLVRCQSIKSVRERFWDQRLELFGFAGEPPLGLPYQLHGFDELRATVLTKIHQAERTHQVPLTSTVRDQIVLTKIQQAERTYHQRYQRKTSYLPGQIGFTLLMLFGAWWLVSMAPWIALGLLVIVAFYVHDFVTTITAITISYEHILIEYPWRKLTIQASDIKSLLFDDTPP